MFLFQKVKFFIRYFFFLLGILDIISVVAALEVVYLVQSV